MMEFFIVCIIAAMGFMVGIITTEVAFNDRCIAKYSEMPHNKVEDHCKQLLKFEKEPK